LAVILLREKVREKRDNRGREGKGKKGKGEGKDERGV